MAKKDRFMPEDPQDDWTDDDLCPSKDDVWNRIHEKYAMLQRKPLNKGDEERISGEFSKKSHSPQKKENKTFSMTPKAIKSYLDKYVISQEQAKKDISVAVAFHYSRVSSDNIEKKNNLLVIGPTGVGKTYTMQKIAEIANVPFVEVDISKFTKTGYVGMSVDDILRYVITKSGNNLEKAKRSIVYIDEIDKIKTQYSSGGGRDINGQEVQTELLKIMEGACVPVVVYLEGDRQKMIEVNTKEMLFVCSGAFPDLEPIIASRTGKTKGIGFGADMTAKPEGESNLGNVSVDDLVKYGFLREFLGRLPVITVLSPLSRQDLRRILSEPAGSIIEQYRNEMKPFGIELEITDEALEMIADRAYNHKIGARALNTVCEEVLKQFKYELPGSGIKKLLLTKDAVLEPEKELARILAGYGKKA